MNNNTKSHWAWSISAHALEKLITSNNDAELRLSHLLKENGYSVILDGISLNGESWGQRDIIDLSGLSLKNCTISNLNANQLLFNDSNLENAALKQTTGFISIDFTGTNLKKVYMGHLITDAAIFNSAMMNGAIIISGRNLSSLLAEEQYKQIIHIKVEPDAYFNQEFLIKKYDKVIDPLGVCNGLAIDFARHISLHSQENYITHLKEMQVHHSNKFAHRIASYQDSLQTFDLYTAHEAEIQLKDINKHGFFEALPDNLKYSNILGFTVKGPLGAHIISIAKKGTGYIIFDPNIGEINCYSQSSELNEYELNQQIYNLYCLYHKRVLAFGSLRVSDLEGVIKEVGSASIKGCKVKKYDLNGLYIGLIFLFCLLFTIILHLSTELNEIYSVILSLILSFLITIYLASSLNTFYKQHLSQVHLKEL